VSQANHLHHDAARGPRSGRGSGGGKVQECGGEVTETGGNEFKVNLKFDGSPNLGLGRLGVRLRNHASRASGSRASAGLEPLLPVSSIVIYPGAPRV
jgi:hypothetical protein